MNTIETLQRAAARMREERDRLELYTEQVRRQALYLALKHVSSAISEIDEAATLVGGSFFDGSDEAVAACMRCGSPREGDLCSDETCPYSEHAPDEPSKLLQDPPPKPEPVPVAVGSSRRERVLSQLTCVEWRRTKTIAAALGMSQENVGFTLRLLRVDGLVEQDGNRGPWRLVPPKGVEGAEGPACPTGDQQLDQSEEEVPADGPLA